MYVVPFSMGPLGSDKSHIGVQLTDSRLRRRLHADHDPHGPGRARRRSATTASSCPACTRSGRRSSHGQDDVPWPTNAETKYIVHYPETREIWSYGSGYGGNALLGKKCFALRIASVMARDEGWMAEHMLILKLTSPEGAVEVRHRRVPVGLRQDEPRDADPDAAGLEGRDGRRRHRVDEVRRRRPPLRDQPRGRLLRRRAGHGRATNPNAMASIERRHDLHQLRADRRRRHLVGGHDGDPPAHAIDWHGNDWTPESDDPAAHPNARFTVPAARRRRSRRSGRTRPASRSTPSSSAGAARRSCRSCARRSTGSTASSSARR